MREFRTDLEAAQAPSLCSGGCRHNRTYGFCLDCFRTKEECAGWRTMTVEDRLEVLVRTHARRNACQTPHPTHTTS
jgi:predicted Fe-S protein YdhL (DUF1289 family)